ncbi:MAG: signal peptidase I [Pseudobdellovibrionaceae bacterium]
MGSWRDYLENILIAIFLALVVRTFIFTGYKVPTSSMAPTLVPGDFIFAYRMPFGFKIPLTQVKLAVRAPERGDVVVFTYPDQPRVSYVKRVIALPGDRVQIENGQVLINEEKLMYRDLPPEKSNDLLSEFISSDLFKAVEEKAPEGSRVLLFQKTQRQSQFGPLIVPPNEVFLLGDNRDSSDDSRYWGTVPIEKIEGRIEFVWLSLNWQQRIWGNRIPTLRWDRTGHSVR